MVSQTHGHEVRQPVSKPDIGVSYPLIVCLFLSLIMLYTL